MSLNIRRSNGKLKQSTANSLRLDGTRIEKLLENARSIIDLLDDGDDKLSGEFIFDKQYVHSLVENLLVKMENMIFDARVLTPSFTEKSYSLFDRCKKASREILSFSDEDLLADTGPHSDDDEFENTVEQRLLRSVMEWGRSPFPQPAATAMALLKITLDETFSARSIEPGIAGTHTISFQSGSVTHDIELVDLGQAMTDSGAMTIENILCRPLQWMLSSFADSAEGQNAKKAERTVRWLVLARGDHLNLQRADEKSALFFEALLNDRADSDHIFVYAGVDDPLIASIPSGWRIESTRKGKIAWIYGAGSETLLSGLKAAGKLLFHS